MWLGDAGDAASCVVAPGAAHGPRTLRGAAFRGVGIDFDAKS
jgi:hypothetical protein